MKTKATEGPRTAPILKTSTLKERGPTLPLGITDGSGGLAREIEVRPWRMREEEALGKIRDMNKRLSAANYTSLVVSFMTTRLGHHDFSEKLDAKDKKALSKRKSIVSSMFMGDVYYAYVWLRMQAMGNIVQLSVTCEKCGHVTPFPGDLETLSVTHVESIEDARFHYMLKHPMEVRGKEVAALVLGPPRWAALEAMGVVGEGDSGTPKAAMVLAGIHGYADQPDLAPVRQDMMDMAKVDLESIVSLLNKNHVGPDMSVEGQCEKCSNDFVTSIDWGYDSFFGISSR